MKCGKGNTIFALIEIAIGAVTFFAVMGSFILGRSTKPAQVVVFVLTTAVISFSLGIGILRRSLHSLHLLVFLSTVIVFSKILIFFKIIMLNGALETTIPQPIKDLISVVYHSVLIWYYSFPASRKEFTEKSNALFFLQTPFLRWKKNS